MKIEFKSKRSSTFELRVRALITEMKAAHDYDVNYWGDDPNPLTAGSFHRRFTEELKKLSPQGNYQPSFCFKSFLANDEQSCEIWHVKPWGDKDRLVAIIQN